ncbi:MAG: hypothetical protein U0S12_03825 [Fimbriimonadales bacterium]
MAVRPSSLIWLVVKWMAVPILVGLLGYYVVAPRLGAPAAPPTASSTEEVPQAEAPEAPKLSTKFSGEPIVEVSVRKPERSKKIRRGSKKKPAEETPSDAQPPAPESPDPAPSDNG